MIKNINKKIISTILSFTLLSGGLFTPQKTEAVDFSGVAKNVVTGLAVCALQAKMGAMLTYFLAPIESATDIAKVPVSTAKSDTIKAAQASKECTLDAAANQLKKTLIIGMIRSTTEWVKGGFEGSPAFLEDPEQFLNDATDKWVGNIIESNEYTKVLCNSFKIPLKFAVNLEFYSKKKDEVSVPTCTLSGVEQNIENALGDLKNFYSDDGKLDANSFWNSFVTTNTTKGGNAYGAYIQVSDDLKRLIGEENQKKLDDVNRNGGFMSIEQCKGKNESTYAGDASRRACGNNLSSCLRKAGGDAVKQKSCSTASRSCLKSNSGKKNCKYVTPGKIIADEVSGVLGMERENLLLADEFDELIAALIDQLMSKIFSPGIGLSGIDKSDIGGKEGSINAEKEALMKMYSVDAFEIELKIYQSIHKTLINFMDKITELKDELENKKSEYSKPESSQIIYRKKKDNSFEKITLENIDSYINILNNAVENGQRVVRDLKRIEDRIDFLGGADGKSGMIKIMKESEEKIKEAKTIEDLRKLFVDADGKSINPAEIYKAYQKQKSYLRKYDQKWNGTISGHEQSGALRSGGYILIKKHLEKFIKTRCGFIEDNFENITTCAPSSTPDSPVWSTLRRNLDLAYENIKDDYDPISDIEELTYKNEGSADNTKLEGILEKEEQYGSIISSDSPANASGKRYKTWGEFFEKEEKTILNPYDKKDGKSYLAFLKSRDEVPAWDSKEKKTYTSYNYKTYSFPVSHYAIYPNGISEAVDNIEGQGLYKTTSDKNDISWESYRVFIPPTAKKFALLFKSEDSSYLYRAHLTFAEGDLTIDHRKVKALQYKDDSSDSNHASLKDLFTKNKTVLINLLEYNDSIGVELEPGINNMGLILGEEEIKRYISEKGGWLYVDIIKDNYAIPPVKPTRKTYLDILYYIDMDSDSEVYKAWKKKVGTDFETKVNNVQVVGIDKE